MDVNQHQHCPRFLASLSLDNLRRQLFEPMGSSEFSDFLKLGISTASAATLTKRETTGKPREAFAEAKTETERETQRDRERRTHKDKHKMAAPRKRTLLKVIILGDSG